MSSSASTPASAPPGPERRVLWIGGAQWAGKSTVALLLSARYPLIRYSYDYHDARAHAERARAHPTRYPRLYAWIASAERDPDAIWVETDPPTLAEATRRVWDDRFPMVLDDLAMMPDGVTAVAEGWGLRRAVAPLIESPRQAIFLVPTEAFRQQQSGTLPRARSLSIPGVSDPARAQRNRVGRDRLLAQEAVERAETLGLRVVHVDGDGGVSRIVSLVEEHFGPYLPRWIY